MHFRTCIRQALLFTSLLLVTSLLYAEVIVGPLEQISSQRVSRTDFEYTYKLQLQNTGDAVSNVSVVVTSTSGSTIIVDGNLTFGDIGSGATASSQDTFSFRQNRRVAFDPGALQYDIQMDTVVAPSVVITSPPSLTTLGASPVSIEGEISPEQATLVVNGIDVSHSGGVFSAQVSLEEGSNTIEARAILGEQIVSDIVSISLDLTPPYVTIESHQDGQTVFEEQITVTGLVNDIVRGTIEEDQANVTVNGVPATISNRSYAATINVSEGANTISVVGTDQVGNTGTTSITLTYEVPVGKRLVLVAGQNQSAIINEVLANPLSVKVLDDNDAPVEAEVVVFRVVQGSGAVGAGTATQGRAVVAETDAEGMVETGFLLGSRVGTANHKVTAAVVGIEGELVFNASATGRLGNKLSVNSGNNQRGAVGQVLPEPFVVVVNDAGANVVKDARVAFEVTTGGGSFRGGDALYETVTDSDGRATAEYVLGDLGGIDAQRVTARLIDAEGGQLITAGFSATAFVPADPGLTTISGVVLDNQDNPIPGVTVRVEGTVREAVTDAQGQFLIEQVPVGPVHLIADGSTAQVEGEFPSLSYNLVTIAGVDNPLSAPIYMVKLNDDAVYAGPEDVVLELPDYPGFKLEIARDSVTFPDGSREGSISVTPVNASKVPMAPPNGMQPQFIVTIQPTGTKFDPPARLTLPNVDAHAPGAQVEMYSYDHDLEEFVAIGLGTVSEDGALVESNPGVGVIKAGWHCGSQPGGSGCTHNCAICQDCDANCNCVNADNDPRLGTCEKCNNGTKEDAPTDAECCTQSGITSDADYIAGDLLGTVVCCRGATALCMYPANFDSSGNAKGDQIGFDCVSVHEAKHFDHVTCEDDDCETWPSFKDGVTAAQGECEASKAEKTCLDGKRPSCDGDAACEAVVDGWIQEAIDYGNGFYTAPDTCF